METHRSGLPRESAVIIVDVVEDQVGVRLSVRRLSALLRPTEKREQQGHLRADVGIQVRNTIIQGQKDKARVFCGIKIHTIPGFVLTTLWSGKLASGRILDVILKFCKMSGLTICLQMGQLMAPSHVP